MNSVFTLQFLKLYEYFSSHISNVLTFLLYAPPPFKGRRSICSTCDLENLPVSKKNVVNVASIATIRLRPTYFSRERVIILLAVRFWFDKKNIDYDWD